jgi:hypothetical protein
MKPEVNTRRITVGLIGITFAVASTAILAGPVEKAPVAPPPPIEPGSRYIPIYSGDIKGPRSVGECNPFRKRYKPEFDWFCKGEEE